MPKHRDRALPLLVLAGAIIPAIALAIIANLSPLAGAAIIAAALTAAVFIDPHS